MKVWMRLDVPESQLASVRASFPDVEFLVAGDSDGAAVETANAVFTVDPVPDETVARHAQSTVAPRAARRRGGLPDAAHLGESRGDNVDRRSRHAIRGVRARVALRAGQAVHRLLGTPARAPVGREPRAGPVGREDARHSGLWRDRQRARAQGVRARDEGRRDQAAPSRAATVRCAARHDRVPGRGARAVRLRRPVPPVHGARRAGRGGAPWA